MSCLAILSSSAWRLFASAGSGSGDTVRGREVDGGGMGRRDCGVMSGGSCANGVDIDGASRSKLGCGA